MDRSNWNTRKLRRDELEDELVPGTPGERMMMMWQLTRDAWRFLGLADAFSPCRESDMPDAKRTGTCEAGQAEPSASEEPGLRRDIVRTFRRGR